MLTTLAKGGESSTPLVFILDRFDMFAEHTNQILLYNLFDIAQSQQTPICVIGVSGKLDSINMLEKRVKSRFSHRIIDLYPLESLECFHEIAKSALLLQEEENPSDVNREKYNKHVQVSFGKK
jgi:origin recognition complex subunit 4